jgi:hypothetical protein
MVTNRAKSIILCLVTAICLSGVVIAIAICIVFGIGLERPDGPDPVGDQAEIGGLTGSLLLLCSIWFFTVRKILKTKRIDLGIRQLSEISEDVGSWPPPPND